ncbi:AAA family ATPase [Cyclonatronum proteinivorum]|nr:AAA family ATPase [Cyclonatronum proteinivorum]
MQNPGINEQMGIVKTARGYGFDYHELVRYLPPGFYEPAFDTEARKFCLNRTAFGNSTEAQTQYISQNYFEVEAYVKPFAYLRKSVDKFLASKAFYNEKKLDYKRSFLLCGDPGTGKSRFIAQMAERAIKEQEAVVIRVHSRNSFEELLKGVDTLASFLSDRMKIIIIEELYELIKDKSLAEVLNLLDSPKLKENVLFMITTNHPDRIPYNLIDRPSRIDEIIPVYKEDFQSEFIIKWFEHVMEQDFPEKELNSGFLKDVSGKLTLAYLQEVFLKSYMEDLSLSESYRKIKIRQEMISRQFARSGEIGF